MTFSLSSRKWEWDEDVIAARTISDGVAELLTRRLLRLPEKALQVLRVLSIFGTSVEMEVLSHISDFCGTDRNIIDELCKYAHLEPHEMRVIQSSYSNILITQLHTS